MSKSVFDNGGLIGVLKIPNSSNASGIWSLSSALEAKSAGNWPTFQESLYEFTSFTFTSAGLTGGTGPTLAQCLSSYNTTTNPWLSNTSYFNVTTTGIQEWKVPKTGIYEFTLSGAQGGTGYVTGGLGGQAIGRINLTLGQIVYIVVGQTVNSGALGTGGWGGGGTALRGGGGASDVRIDGNALADRKIVAGGGGGSPFYNSTYDFGAGAGGGLNGTGGFSGTNGSVPTVSGGGGSQSAGGAAGTGNFGGGVAGSLGQGGNGNASYSGAGGGGYYGGGGGSMESGGSNYANGGGGGSSYFDTSVTNTSTTTGINSGNGNVAVTFISA